MADAEAGFGGPLNVFELIKAMIEAGAAGVHLEDQLASEKKCGHMGGKVLVPTRTAIAHLTAGRLAADVCKVPTIVIARTDANAAALLTSDIDERDHEFLTGERTAGRFLPRARRDRSGDRARAELRAVRRHALVRNVQHPISAEAKKFAERMHAEFPGQTAGLQLLALVQLEDEARSPTIAKFQRELGAMGYKFQFVTLAGFHALNYSMFKLAHGYRDRGMAAYSELQEAEFAAEADGYTATKHQHEVGTGYFDDVARVIAGGESSTAALRGSTEEEQFH